MNEKNKKIKLLLIKTDKSCYIRDAVQSYSGNDLTWMLVDGKHPRKTFSDYWFEIESPPVSIMKTKPDINVNYRMVLKSEILERDGFSGTTLGRMRPEIPRDECMEYIGYSWEWKPEFSHLSSLYELKFDKEPQEPEPVEFECRTYCEIPDLEMYAGTKYVVGMKWDSGSEKPVTTGFDRVIKHRAIDTIIYPDIIHPSCPSFIPSDDMYRIVRFHIKQNIDYRYATISSDHDFCFTVEKKIIESKDYLHECDVPTNKKNVYGRPKNTCIVFEMTPQSKKYKNYTVIPKLEAANAVELQKKLDNYLNELIDFINDPVVVCEHCNGTGVGRAVEKFGKTP